MRFGIFISPIHSPRENANLALHRDVEIVRHVESLGFDEAWIGEHHATGWEFVSSPEVFIAHTAALTSRIRLGTGVISIPYHHPYHVAERIVLLDHLTRGRVMLGLGPGALVEDALQLGIDPMQTRQRLEEGLETVLALLSGERISRTTDWFTLKDAKLQLLPYSKNLEVAVTATFSPAGAKLAGKYGCSLLSLTATQEKNTSLLSDHWRVVLEQSIDGGRPVDRRNWRLVGPMHLATDESQARRDVQSGLAEWARYMTEVASLPVVPKGLTDSNDLVNALTANGYAIIGTPEQAIRQIQRLVDASGGFGTFLLWSHDWASREATLRSYELFARYVMPAFNHYNPSLIASEAYAIQGAERFVQQAAVARQKAVTDYAAERTKPLTQ
jgi:limonene 1,2-monooxygenase